jgi:hypothetical protein
MARTKSTESTSLDHAQALPPAKKYQPTPAEQAVLDQYRERAKQQLAPEFKVSYGDGIVKIGPDHRDPQLGTVLLMNALGTANEALFKGLVLQLSGLATAKLPEEIELKQNELNFAVSMMQGIKPRDETEALLATQMAAIHNAVMTAAWRLAKSENIPQRDSASRMLNQCARTFTAQLEALKKYRSNGEQIVKVQHVNIGNGGQAIVTDTLQTGGGGGYGKIEHRPHAKDSPEPALLSKIEAIGPAMQSASGRVPDARGNGPTGSRNGRYKHVQRTKEAIEQLRGLRKLIRAARAAIADLE